MWALILHTMMLTLGTAQADGYTCVECCRAEGLVTCPTRVRVFGDGSMATPEADGWRLIGVWSLDCDAGASFDSGGTALIADEPGAGEVLRGASPRSTVRCFAQHCALPDGACIRERDDRFYLERCSDGEALSAAYMRVPGRPVRGPGSAPVAPLASAPTRPAAAGSTPAIELPTPPGGDCDLPPVLRAEAARGGGGGARSPPPPPPPRRGVWASPCRTRAPGGSHTPSRSTRRACRWTGAAPRRGRDWGRPRTGSATRMWRPARWQWGSHLPRVTLRRGPRWGRLTRRWAATRRPPAPTSKRSRSIPIARPRGAA